MNIKQRIWSLPMICGLVFGLGVAVSIAIASGALRSIDRVGSLDYPYLENAKAVQAAVAGITDDLQSAVAEGEAAQLVPIDKRAGEVRELISRIEGLKGHERAGQLLRSRFDAYYASAVEAAKLMLNVSQGDTPRAIARMQASLNDLNPVLERTVAGAQRTVTAALQGSGQRVRAALWVMVAVVLIVMGVLAFTAQRTTLAIWKQLGGEPEAIGAAARRLAAGDLNSAIAVAANDSQSAVASMAALQSRLSAVISELNEVVDAAGRGDLSRRVGLEGKEGCYRDIATSVNRWSANSQTALREVARSLAAIAHGELPPPSTNRLEGEYGEMQRHADNTVAAIERLAQELGVAVARAQRGDFSQQIDTQGLKGFQTELAGGINMLIDVTAQGLESVSGVLVALSHGDLTQRSSAQLDGEFGELIRHADVAVGQLGSLVSDIRRSSVAITCASREITGQEGRAGAQSRASLEQLTQVIHSNAESARQANELANHASAAASGGKDIVTSVISTMTDINQASKFV